MTTLIGITGKAGAGKDTFAEMLNRSLGFERYSFAGPIKDACAVLFGWDRQALDHDREFKEAIDPRWGFSPRKAMQLMGTEYGRNMLRDDIWIQAATNRYKTRTTPGFIVSDVRFENESQWIRDNGGVLIHIVRPGAPSVIAHASEDGVSVAEGDIVITNGTSIDALLVQAQNLAANLR